MNRRKWFYGFIAIIILIIAGLYYFYLVKPKTVNKNIEKAVPENPVQITFLDIGQGDATFLRFPDNQTMLIDCAKDRVVLPALGRVLSFQERVIDYLVITHPDLDHFGGCVDVLRNFTVKHIIINGFEKEFNQSWQSFLAAAKDEVTTEHAEFSIDSAKQEMHFGDAVITFLYPDHAIAIDAHVPQSKEQPVANDTSIVTLIQYGKEKVLLMGDAEKLLEDYLIQQYGNILDVDILKLGHHGSKFSSTPEFIQATSPRDAIASAGAQNKYGHPSLRIVKRVERTNATVWRTDTQGDILVELKKDSYAIHAQGKE